jgi:hypothetical protein
VSVAAAGQLGRLIMTPGSGPQPCTLSGTLDVQRLSVLDARYANADHLTVHAADGISVLNVRNASNLLLSAGEVGRVTVMKNLEDSMILTGYDIGADRAFGTNDDGVFLAGHANIGPVTILGDLIRTSIAANVHPGVDGWFGTGDDLLLAPSLEGALRSLTVRGALIGSTNAAERFGIVAHKGLGALRVGATTHKGPWTQGVDMGNLTIRDSIG